MSFCAACGTRMRESAKYCTGCGAEAIDAEPALHDGSQPPPEATASTEVLDPSESEPCPSCKASVRIDATKCRACRFELQKWRETLAGKKVVSMTAASGSESYIEKLVNKHYEQGGNWTGCSSFLYLGFGFLIMFIPVVGYIAGPLMVLSGLLAMFAPKTFEQILDREAYARAWQQAAMKAANTYLDAQCPVCRASLGTISWKDGSDGSIECPGCRSKSLRIGDRLVFVPHPSVSLLGPQRDYLEP